MIDLRNQSGDTIIEVLIVIAVISLVLAGAYNSSGRSLGATRTSQERSEATQLVEGQLERLRIAAVDPDSGVFTNTNFCLTENQTVVANTDPQCQRTPAGVTYALSITRPTNGNDETFTARAQWDKAGGGTSNNVAIIYRIRK